MSFLGFGSLDINNSITKSVNEAITSTLLSNTGSCNSSNTITLNQEVSGFDTSKSNCTLNMGNISQRADQNTKMTCIIKSEIDSEIVSKVLNKVAENLQAKSNPKSLINLGPSIGINNTVTDIQNIVKDTVDLKNISSCIIANSVKMDQKVKDFDIGCPKYCSSANPNPLLFLFNPKGCTVNIDNIEQYGVQTVVAKCLFDNKIFSKRIQEISTDLEKKVNEENAPKQISAVSSSICCVLVLSIGFAVAGYASKDDPKMQLMVFALLILCICCSCSSSFGFVTQQQAK